MRIGLVAPPWLPVPPPSYGGTESVVANLARGLQDRGHDVVLFTVGESTCPVRRASLFPRAPMGMSLPEAAHVLAAYDALRDADVIHDHTVLGPLLAGRRGLTDVPVVVTHHGPFDDQARPVFAEIARTALVVAISHDHARHARSVPVAAVVHHGVDLQAHHPSPTVGEFLVFLGRMSPDKGPHRALRIARQVGLPLRIVTKMREAEELDFCREVVKPLMSAEDELVVEPGAEEKVRLLASAVALVNPIAWPEPFGLAMAESLACGTPVVAAPYGAAPEIVRDGVTGFLRDGVERSARATARVGELDRTACRDDAERRFSVERMARDYERVYERALQAAGEEPARTAYDDRILA